MVKWYVAGFFMNFLALAAAVISDSAEPFLLYMDNPNKEKPYNSHMPWKVSYSSQVKGM